MMYDLTMSPRLSNTSFYVQYRVKGLGYTKGFDIHRSPFHNCQMYSIGNAQFMIGMTEEQLAYTLYKVIHYYGKYMFTMDIKIEHSKHIRKVLKPFKISFQSMYYTNTNGSAMCMIICKLDYRKLRDIYDNQNLIKKYANFTINHNN